MMKLSKLIKLFAVAIVFWMTPAAAEKITPEVTELLKGLGIPLENVHTTPVNGLYELQVGTQIFYVSADGKYLLTGSLLDMTTKENLTDNRMKGIRLAAINKIPADQMISFKAKDEKYLITVFTDIDCGYCRKLHSEIEQYNQQGISVNYLFYPRTGPGTQSYYKAVSVWCNNDRNQAMTQAKAGKEVPKANCENPVARHFQLGTELGVGGTPYIITDHGDMLPGYVPPTVLRQELDKATASNVSSASKEVSLR